MINPKPMSLIKRKAYLHKWFHSDLHFNQLYPLFIQQLTPRHWTPLSVARKAANFLNMEKNVKILDIGSGAGKFCMAAAYYQPEGVYYGVEQRQVLVQCGQEAKEILGLENVFFIHGNFTQLDFREYDHFYFYNAFYENLVDTQKIDNSIEYSEQLYHYYCRYLYKQLEQKPPGTRIATFHSLEDELPATYQVVGSEMNGLLKFWIKID